MNETVYLSVQTELYEQLETTAEALGMPVFWATREAIREWITNQQKWEVVIEQCKQEREQEDKNDG